MRVQGTQRGRHVPTSGMPTSVSLWATLQFGRACAAPGHLLCPTLRDATQSLLQAVGVGAKRSLPAAATINWVLKDGLGRLGRLTVATRFGESFDSDLKRFRYTTSVIYALSLRWVGGWASPGGRSLSRGVSRREAPRGSVGASKLA